LVARNVGFAGSGSLNKRRNLGGQFVLASPAPNSWGMRPPRDLCPYYPAQNHHFWLWLLRNLNA